MHFPRLIWIAIFLWLIPITIPARKGNDHSARWNRAIFFFIGFYITQFHQKIGTCEFSEIENTSRSKQMLERNLIDVQTARNEMRRSVHVSANARVAFETVHAQSLVVIKPDLQTKSATPRPSRHSLMKWMC